MAVLCTLLPKILSPPLPNPNPTSTQPLHLHHPSLGRASRWSHLYSGRYSCASAAASFASCWTPKSLMLPIMSPALPGKVVSCWWWFRHHHCSAEQVDGMATLLQTASHGVHATTQPQCPGSSMPSTMSTCWTYALQHGRKNVFFC